MAHTKQELKELLKTIRTVEARIIRVRDVQEALGLSSESVAHALLMNMLEAGLVKWHKRGSRGVWELNREQNDEQNDEQN